ncbi:MAG: insulinase family protein [Dehalococcoidales bacterium]|nr:MAG: insulinase family protein [Dehalococcoidales bacterium]
MHQKTVLDNGLRVVSTTMPHTHSVSISYLVGTGSRYETEEQAGVSHFIEHLVFKGNTRRPTSKDISAAIEGVGGGLNGGTDRESTVYWARVARPNFLLALEVLTDMLLNSLFDPQELERERSVIIEEINMTKDVPAHQVHLLTDEILWPDHPLGRDIAGSKETMTKITREMMLDYMESMYLPENTVIAIAGNIQHEEAVDAVSQVTSGWTAKKNKPGYLPYSEKPNPRILIEKRDTEQAHLCLALPGLPILHPERFILDILNIVLGEGMSSRLFTEIRDRLGLAYSIHSFNDHLQDTGSMTIAAGVEPRNLTVAVEAIVRELSLMRETIPEEELTKAKEFAKGRLLLRMEDTRSVAGWTGGQEILTDTILTLEEVVAKIDSVTVSQLQETAGKVILGENLRLAVVGPVEDEKTLESLLHF